MFNVKESYLYQMIQFSRKFQNSYLNVNEIYYFIYGYSSVFHSPNITTNIKENWINDFFLFINQRLREKLYPNEELRSCHFGLIINEFIHEPKIGIEMFYNLLDEFLEKYDQSEVVEQIPVD